MKYRRNRKRTNNGSLKIVLIVVLVLLIVAAAVMLISTVSNNLKEKREEEKQQEIIEKETIKETPQIEVDDLSEIEAIISKDDRYAIEQYNNYVTYNSNTFRGIVQFKSGLIEQPFVQSVDNDYYLRRDWITNNYSVMGSIFMDYECSLDSQNIILYGHNAFSSWYAGTDNEGNELINDELMFTPLKFLTNKSNYENNKYVNLILRNEVREYEIVSVYYCNLTGEGSILYPDDELQYYLPEYSDSYFKIYKAKIDNVEFYDTGVSYSNSDKFLTLQTCVEGNSMAREIVLCKEINRYSLDREAYKEYQTRIEKRNAQLAQIDEIPDEYTQE